MRMKDWIGIGLITVGGIGLAYIVVLALYLYLPNTLVKVLVCLLMFGIGVFLVYKSKMLTNGALRGIFHRGKR